MRIAWRIRIARPVVRSRRRRRSAPIVSIPRGWYGRAPRRLLPTRRPPQRAVPGLAGGDGVVGREALGAQKRDMLAGELQQFGFLAGLRFVRDDNDGFT